MTATGNKLTTELLSQFFGDIATDIRTARGGAQVVEIGPLKFWIEETPLKFRKFNKKYVIHCNDEKISEVDSINEVINCISHNSK